MKTTALIIAGMHRSGTSLTASLFQSLGVNIGEKLLGPELGNIRGHFEDIAFAICCVPCTISQLARQTANYDCEEAKFLTSNGLEKKNDANTNMEEAVEFV